jgi:hypothetical protein
MKLKIKSCQTTQQQEKFGTNAHDKLTFKYNYYTCCIGNAQEKEDSQSRGLQMEK